MKIYITRHGKTLWNEQGIIQGNLDSPLTDEGIQRAKQLSKRILQFDIQAIITSDLKRAKDTSIYIKNKSDVPIFYFKELREMSFGNWDGMKISDIKSQYYEDFIKLETDPLNFDNKSGETFSNLMTRVKKVIEIIKSLNYENILIVTHGMTIKALQILFENKNIKDIVNLPVINGCSLIAYEVQEDKYERILSDDSYAFEPVKTEYKL